MLLRRACLKPAPRYQVLGVEMKVTLAYGLTNRKNVLSEVAGFVT
jgi:hypothetical protein